MADRKTGRWLNRNIVALGCASVFIEMGSEMASAVLPVFLSSVLGAPAFALGIIEGVGEGLSTIFELWSGWYSDRVGKRKGLSALFYLLVAVSIGGFAFVTNWLQLVLLGWSLRAPVRDALLVESTTAATVNRAFAFLRTLETLGAITGPLIATLLLSRVATRVIFLVALVPCLCAALSIILFIGEKTRKSNLRSFRQSFDGLSPGFLPFLVPVFVFAVGQFAPTFLILRAQDLLMPVHGTLTAAAYAAGLYTWSNVAYALVSYPMGLLADRYGKKAILAAGYALFGILCAGFIVANGDLWTLAVLFALNGISTAIVEASEPALASTFIGDEERGAKYGMLSAIEGSGGFLSSIVVGLLWTFVSPAAGFVFGAILALTSAVLLMRMKTGG